MTTREATERITLNGVFKTIAFGLVTLFALDMRNSVASIGEDVQDIKVKIAVIEVNLGDVGKIKTELQETRDRLLIVESLLFGKPQDNTPPKK